MNTLTTPALAASLVHIPWGTWRPDESGGEVYVENLDRALRRQRVLRQVAEGRRLRQARGLR